METAVKHMPQLGEHGQTTSAEHSMLKIHAKLKLSYDRELTAELC